MENFENKIEKEKGVNVELVLHILRHGDKTPGGVLEQYGRERTKEVAKDVNSNYSPDMKIKAFGSPAGPKSAETGMQRSLETAHIFGKEIANLNDGKEYSSRSRSLLNYEDWDVLLIDPEYDYSAIYKKILDEYMSEHYEKTSYEDLTEKEQKESSFYASNGATRYYLELDTDPGIKSRMEVAGTFAVLIKHYIKMAQEKLKSNQKFLFPIGSHTGTIEPFLVETVIWKDENGNEIHGATLDQLGGILKPSEGFDIVLKTNQNGKLEQVKMSFDDQKRLGGNVSLDMQKIDELASFYNELHKKENASL